MSKIALEGNASGTGTFTIAGPNTNTNYTITLPQETGTLFTTGATTGLNASALSTGTTAVARGGTGQNTYTDGQLLIGNSTGNTLAKNTLTAGSGISITNGAGTITIAASGGGGALTTAIEAYNSPATFTAPPTTNSVMVWLTSGGGGGGGSGQGNPSGNGGAGVFAAGIYPVTGGSPYAVTVGAAGAAGNYPGNPPLNGNPGGAGGASSFGNLLTANGGNAGGGAPQNGTGSPGNTGTAPLSEIPVITGLAASYAVWSNNAGSAGSGNPGPVGGGPTGPGTAGGPGRVLIFY